MSDDINDTDDCLRFARIWAGHPGFASAMRSQAEAMESVCGLIRDDAKMMRWAKCIRFLRWAERTNPNIVASCSLAKAADIGWAIIDA